MDEKKKKILKCIQKHNEKQYVNKKQIKAKKKKMRKARNHLLELENRMSELEPLEDSKRRDVSDLETLFWRTNLIEAQETIKNLTLEIGRLNEVLKSKEQDLQRSQEEKKIYTEIAEKHSLKIETLREAAKKKKSNKENFCEKSFGMENKIKNLSTELRQQRAKNRQLKSELIAFQEDAEREDTGMSDVHGVVNIKITKATGKSTHRKTSKGINNK